MNRLKLKLLIAIIGLACSFKTQAKVYNISDFGAVNDGITLNTSKIQAAIDQCTFDGGGTVLLTGGGKYMSGTIYLKDNVTLHIGNIFKENALKEISVCKDSLLTAKDGKNYKTKIYNLDVIISVGYRVKSKRGTQFRIWANNILKDYLLKGYALNQRVDKIERKLLEHDQKFDLIIKTALPPVEGIFYNGQIFDAWKFVADIIKTAKVSIILIDNYIDESVLLVLKLFKVEGDFRA